MSWFTSSHSGNGNCVQVRQEDAVVYMRDTKNGEPGAMPNDPIIAVPLGEWDDFLKRACLFDDSYHPTFPSVTRMGGENILVQLGSIGLEFTPGEWYAFLAGIRDGEFSFAQVGIQP